MQPGIFKSIWVLRPFLCFGFDQSAFRDLDGSYNGSTQYSLFCLDLSATRQGLGGKGDIRHR